MRLITLALMYLVPVGASAQTVLSDVQGNWAAPQNNGFYYRAVLSTEGDHLRLRIWQSLSPEITDGDLQFDNAAIAWGSTRPESRDWLEVAPDGRLMVKSSSMVEGYLYGESLTIAYMDNQFTAMAYGFYNTPNAASGADPFSCSTADCYSCEADLWNGTAMAGGEAMTPQTLDFEAMNASLWTPDRIFELGFCPAPN